MLLKHGAYYALARGIPGIINFLGMALYTRLLHPEAYGQYALVIAGTTIASVVLFQWLRLGLLRFLPAYQGRREVVLSTVLAGFVGLLCLTGLGGMLALIFIVDPGLRGLVVLGVALLWVSAFFELNLELARIELSPRRYGALGCANATVAVTLGGALAYQGFGPAGLLYGSLSGMSVALLWQSRNEWKVARLHLVDMALIRRLLAYGVPLTASFALWCVISSSDRLLIGWFLDGKAAGLYAVGYDLSQYALGMAMSVVNLAAYPLAVRALEQNGKHAADHQLAQNAILLVAVALPAAAGLALLSANIAEVLLGQAYRDTAAALIPWIALSAFLSGIKAYYFDLSFQLGEYTMGQVWVFLVAASINLVLNCWWIPTVGLMGAAYAAVIAYGVGLGLSWLLGRRVFELPLPIKDITKVALAALGMVLALMPIVALKGALALTVQVVWGALVYGTLIFLLDAGGMRNRLFRRLDLAWGYRA